MNISVPLEIQMRQSSHYASAVASAVVPVGTGAARVGVMVAPALPPAVMAAEASVMLCNQFDFVGGNGTRLYGCVYVQYNPFEDAPQEGKLNWGKLVGKIIGAIAIVALVAIAVLLTGGSAVPVLLGAVICGGVAATATVAIGAATGEFSSVEEMIYAGLDSFCNGAVMGAVAAAIPMSAINKISIAALKIAAPYAIGVTASFVSMEYDRLFDETAGYDHFESQKNFGDYAIATVASLLGTGIGNFVSANLSQWANRIMKGISKKTIDRYIFFLGQNGMDTATMTRAVVRGMTEYP